MKIITRDQLIKRLHVLKTEVASKNPSFDLHYQLATDIIRTFFGPEYLDRHKSFFLFDIDGDNYNRIRHYNWIIEIGEILFNLQNIKGFERKVNELKGVTPESMLADLQAAMLLFQSGRQIEFVTPQNKKGLDYDLCVNLNGELVPCEVESKLDQGELSHNTLYRTLTNAKKQLPKTNQNLIIVKIPEKWTRNPSIESVVKGTIDKLFSNSERILSVIVIWDNVITFPNGPSIVALQYREYRNMKSILLNASYPEFLKEYGTFKCNTWVEIMSLHAA